VAAGDGRLTATELDERVEAALTARTKDELVTLTADLPAVPGQEGSVAAQAKDVVRLDYQGGNATRRNRYAGADADATPYPRRVNPGATDVHRASTCRRKCEDLAR